MAYLRELRGVKCNNSYCNKQAVVEAFDNRNGRAGNWCRKHGNEVLARLSKEQR